MNRRFASAEKIAARYVLMKFAAPLRDVSKLRHQAVFLMGAGGSGKGAVGYKWLKYMPGGGEKGISQETYKEYQKGDVSLPQYDPKERLLSDIDFTRAVQKLKTKGFDIELEENPTKVRIPFKLFSYDQYGRERMIPPAEWGTTLPPDIYDDVKGIKEIVLGMTTTEVPSYFRQINPDLYKEELPGYKEEEPGYVHEMSSLMSKAYLEAAFETGDPLLIDGTGQDPQKMISQMKLAKSYGYRTSLVYVFVPLTVNHIRNATRSRNVDPDQITYQWFKVRDSYGVAKSAADKAKKIDNRDPARDSSNYLNNKDKINTFIARKTKYSNLYELIADKQPEELADYGKLLQS